MSFPVRLTPKGGRDAIEGWIQGPDGKRYLKARVSAPPEDGRANEALVRLIAKALGVGATRVHIVSGGASRMKIIEAETEWLPAAWENPL
ncbi:MAG: uncharacterized protein QOF03_1235 [Alphaproteobacteria bacterium]|nr:uncharacterized protein [Alphaproteobacteria bacterium]